MARADRSGRRGALRRTALTGLLLAACAPERVPQPTFELPDPAAPIEGPVTLRVRAAQDAPVRAVEFRLGGIPWAVAHEPPFEAVLDPAGTRPGSAEVEVLAAMADGTVHRRTVTVDLGTPAASPRPPSPAPPSNPGSGRTWQPLEVRLRGAPSHVMDPESNPFTIRVDVVFRNGGDSLVVPGFFAGDGAGGFAGDVWMARFNPPSEGVWTWRSRSPSPELDGQEGRLVIAGPAADSIGFGAHGPLRQGPGPYLRFASGESWLKGGADDPEDILGNPYLPTLADKLAATALLADYGVNSLYVMTLNAGGDQRNVWPWVGATEEDARRNHRRFDVARLERWEALFRHLQSLGIVLHLVLEDDGGWTGFDRDLYYREMVARFAHHNGLVWNLAEEYEESYTPEQIRSHAALLRSLDPYDHPVAVHHAGVTQEPWEPFLGDSILTVTSFQTDSRPLYEEAARWRARGREAGGGLVVSFDETGRLQPSQRDLARRIAWSVYLGGANYEVHTAPVYDGSYTYEDYEPLFRDMVRARRFVEALEPWTMQPLPNAAPRGEGWVLGRAGERYAAFLTGPSLTLDLGSEEGAFSVQWLDPESGEQWEGGEARGGRVVLTNPRAPRDVVVVLRRASGGS